MARETVLNLLGTQVGASDGGTFIPRPDYHHELAELRGIVAAFAGIVADLSWGTPYYARAFELVKRAEKIGG